MEPKRTLGDWHEVVVEGWIFNRSIEKTTRDGFDLVVTATSGENIRSAPNAGIVGRVRTGTLLRREEVRGAWTRVSRTGWVPRGAVKGSSAKPVAPSAPEPEPSASVEPDLNEPVESGALPPQAPAPAPAEPARVDTGRGQVVREAALFAAPDGSRFATLQPGAPARVVGRSGDWVRVQLEGWIRDGDLAPGSDVSLGAVTAAEVRADPARYIGRTVDWRLELIAVQTADELRIEIPKGRPYLLTRGPLPEPGFVYVTVTGAQANEFRSLQALQELTLRVTIRAPRTRFLATPVVELVSRVE
ncbi:MAG: SH3 domain-containing protein [Gemmatimonadales bacterium]